MEHRGVSSLFCNDEDEPENEYVFEKTGEDYENEGDEENYIKESLPPETPTEKKKSRKSITVNLPPDDAEKFENLKKALWKEEDAAVMKWCFDKVYKSNKKKIERILEERERIEEEKRRIGTL